MKSINKYINKIEFSDEEESLNISLSFAMVTFSYENRNSDVCEMFITKEDYELFCEFRNLYNDIIKSLSYENNRNKIITKIGKTYKRKTELPKIFIDNKIEVHSCDNKYDKANIMYIEKIDDDTFKLSFDFKNKDNKFVKINCDPFEDRIYRIYDKSFLNMFKKLYTMDYDNRQISMEEYEYSLKLHK